MPLYKFLKEFVKKFHSPPCWDESSVLVTCGGQDGLSKMVEMVLQPEDYIVIQEPFYAGVLSLVCYMNTG